MSDPRYGKLTQLLTGYSTALRRRDRVWIEAAEIPEDFVVELIRAVRARGAEPYVRISTGRISREIGRGVTEAGLKLSGKHELAWMKTMQAFIALRGSQNSFESSDIPAAVSYIPLTLPTKHEV